MFARPAHARKSRSLSLESQTVWRVAERLFRFQTEGKWDTFYNVLPAYAEPLGKNGLRRYRELVNEAWEALPALALGKEYRRSFTSASTRICVAVNSTRPTRLRGAASKCTRQPRRFPP